MSATYIPRQGDTFGEGVGIPRLGLADDDTHGWGTYLDSATATPLDEISGRDRLYAAAMAQRGSSTATNATISSSVPPEVAVQWPLHKVLAWLQANNFSKDWQETFKYLNIQGAQFLDLGSSHGGRGNFGMMHQQVYPRLAIQCQNSGSRWDQPKEREEGKRMRRLIRSIVTGRPVEPSKGHARKDSAANAAPSTAVTEPADSPNVS